MLRLMQLAAVSVGLVAMAPGVVPPALACNPHITMSSVDQALATSGLKGDWLADANSLRAQMAEAVQRNDQRRAHHVETRLMGLMGYVEDPPVSRSVGCGRTWQKRN
jgi:hypothetical protein